MLEEWSDAAIWETVRQTFGLERGLRTAVFDDADVRGEIRRAGVPRACAEIADAVDAVADEASAWFQPAIIAEVRSRVPDQPDFHDRISVSPSGHQFNRMIATLERQQTANFADARLFLRSRLAERLAALDSVEGEWRGPLADWNFDGPNQSVWANACMIAGLSDPASAKAAFDGFYTERDNR